jgi:hypothetical protein
VGGATKASGHGFGVKSLQAVEKLETAPVKAGL